MNIRRKALKIIIITVLILLIILLLVSRFLIFNEFKDIEAKQLGDDLAMLQILLSQELEGINSTNGDWAPWDDTYQFINDSNKIYIENNLGDVTLRNLNINFMVFINNANQIVHAKSVDLHQAGDFLLDSQMIDYLLEKNKDIEFSGLRDYTAGVILYQDDPYFVSFRPISKSEFKGEQNGTLIMGKHIDLHFRNSLIDALKMPVEINIIKDDSIIKDYVETPALSLINGFRTRIELINKRYISGKLAVRDLSGSYRLNFRLLKERDVYAQGLKSMYYLVFIFLLSSALFTYVIFYLLNKTVFIFSDEQQVLLNTIPARIFLKDRDLNYITVNRIFLDEVNYSLGEIKGKDDYDLLPPAEAEQIREWEKNILDNGNDICNNETELQLPDGSKKWISASHGVYRDNKGNVQGLVGIIMDHTEQRKLEVMAYHDYLTGLPNRAKFIEYFEELVNEGRDNITIIYLDLDRFKLINDSFGHDAGDEFLKYIADRLKGFIEDNEIAARFGGDEFAFLLLDIENTELIKKKLVNIIKTIEEPWNYNGQEFKISASMGIVNYPDDGDAISDLLKNVDLAMYYAKNHNLGFKFYTTSLRDIFLEHLTMENDLRAAIGKKELELYYQPLLDLNGGMVNTVEALLRWNHSKQGLLLPDKFIPLAERSGLINSIGEWVLMQACQQINQWNLNYDKKVKVAVNISTVQFKQPMFVKNVKTIIYEMGIDPYFLQFEITESILMAEPENSLVKLNQLKELGIMIVLDDFGTGYSSLSYLKKFPIDKIKIDKSFIMDLFIENNDISIVKAIVDLAINMGIMVTAEGVETLKQLKFLQRLNCDQIQGYYISRPISARDLEQEFIENSQENFI